MRTSPQTMIKNTDVPLAQQQAMLPSCENIHCQHENGHAAVKINVVRGDLSSTETFKMCAGCATKYYARFA